MNGDVVKWAGFAVSWSERFWVDNFVTSKALVRWWGYFGVLLLVLIASVLCYLFPWWINCSERDFLLMTDTEDLWGYGWGDMSCYWEYFNVYVLLSLACRCWLRVRICKSRTQWTHDVKVILWSEQKLIIAFWNLAGSHTAWIFVFV